MLDTPPQSTSHRRRVAVAVAGAIALCAALALPPGAARAQQEPDPESVVVDGTSAGRTFDGVGAISASSSRLLVDYPPQQRSEVLDYLFTPNYGASLQILKVEIGSDSNSTVGAEPSHMRTPDDLDCNRGFEWWLMEEAKARNPDIQLSGLMWGAPGWFGSGWLWGPDHVDYIVKWLDCAAEHGLQIDYIGGGNERGSYDIPFWKALNAALAETYPEVKIVATDQHKPPNYWQIAEDMASDPELNDAIDVIGQHNPCGWRTLYLHCDVTQQALDLNKPLWTSESSSQDAAAGAGPLARARNRNYIDARITGDMQWSMLAAFYGNAHTAGTGLMAAEWPWSGYYQVEEPIWVDAHTTQFTEPGWQYLDDSSGYLESGASYVTLRSDETSDYSVVIETMDATAPQTVQFQVTGGLSAGPVHMWSTQIDSDDPQTQFVHERSMSANDGRFEVRLEPSHVYTLSTSTGQSKGTAESPADPDLRMTLPYGQDFEDTGADLLAAMFQDVNGAYEAAPCGAERTGTCYRQLITEQPIQWQRGGALPPTTLVGDPRWWGDYRVTTQAMLEQPGYVELLGRVEASTKDGQMGYKLQVADTGAWTLYREEVDGSPIELAAGQTDIAFGTEQWHSLALQFLGSQITASIDDVELATVTDVQHSTGQVGLGTSKWQNAQFDDLTVESTSPAPDLMSREQMTATATSEQPGPYEHQFYKPEWALDGRPETQWMTRLDGTPHLPESITIELGPEMHWVDGMVYKPPVGLTRVPYSGIITEYTISLSEDGQSFEEVAQGTWGADIATKVVRWSQSQPARFLRLEATAADGGVAGASEIDVIAGVPVPDPPPTDEPDPPPTDQPQPPPPTDQPQPPPPADQPQPPTADQPQPPPADQPQPPPAGQPSTEDLAPGATRVFGQDRIATSIAIAQQTFQPGEAKMAILARADEYADSLAGSPLATAANGPVILNSSDQLDPRVLAALQHLQITQVTVLGGPAAMAPEVAESLEAAGIAVTRIGGPNRFSTAALIAEALTELSPSEEVFLVEGGNDDPARGWPDALSASGLAAASGVPILLATQVGLPVETAPQLQGKDVTIIGGSFALDEGVESAAGDAASSISRIYGQNRYATSVAVAEEAKARGLDLQTIWVATGLNWPDALTAGAAAGAMDTTVLLVDGQNLDASPESHDFIVNNDEIRHILIAGGSEAVATQVEAELDAAVTND